MKIGTLASGSKGNASFVAGEGSSFLVDCGISLKKLRNSLEGLGYDVENLNGIFITHEHRDHISGLKTFLNKYKVPVFSTIETFDAILNTKGFEGIDKSLFQPIEIGEKLALGGVSIRSFEIPHDAANPVGYYFEKEDKKVAVCTDIGMITDCILENLSNSDAMVLEANHDVYMLQAGRYPYSLKKRILGERGHLSNENTGKLLAKIWNEKLKHVFLGHLSEENNMPELALEAVRCELLENDKEFENFTKLCVASREIPSELVCI